MQRGNPYEDFDFQPKRRHPGSAAHDQQVELAENFDYLPSMREFLERRNRSPERLQVEKHEILPGELFLGHNSLEYSPKNVVAPEFGLYTYEGGRRIFKARNVLVLGPPGIGKTNILHIVTFNNFARRNDVHVVVPDLAQNPEWWLTKYPITKQLRGNAVQEAIDYFAQYRDEVGPLRPEGFSGVVYKPAYLGKFKEQGVDKPLEFTLEDIRDMRYYSPEQATNALLALTGLKSSYSASVQADKILDNEELVTFKDVLDWADKIISSKDGNEKLDNPKFIDRLRKLVRDKFFSDGPRTDSLIRDLTANKFIAFRQPPTQANEDTITTEKNQMGIKLFLTEPENDRRRYVSGTQAERNLAVIRKPIIYNLDEIRTYAPAPPQVSYTRDFFDSIILYGRKNSDMFVGATQFPNTISPSFLQGAEAVFVSGINGDIKGSQGVVDAIIDCVKSLGFRDQIDFLTSMEQRQMNSLGFIVNQWAMLLPRFRKIYYFFPTLSMSGVHFTTA